MDQTVTLILFISSVLIIGAILFIIISFSKGSPRPLNTERYRSRWLEIETGLVRDNPQSYLASIMNADKLLDQALKERGYLGTTMGERMKKCQGKWSNGNGLWAAHKVRNQLAHEPGASVTYERTKQALVAYKQGLKDLGAI